MAARKRKSRKGLICKKTRYRGHYRTVCRSRATGRIVRGSAGRTSKGRKLTGAKKVCPKTWRGKRVKRTKGGGCMVKMGTGRVRFVKKVARKR